jgi:hypothetical protein
MGRMKEEDFLVSMSGRNFPHPLCTKALNGLQKMKINELQLETHPLRRYLLVQVITPPYKSLKAIAIIQDEDEQAVLIQLVNQESEAISLRVVRWV